MTKARTNAEPQSNENLFINGDMTVWQRAENFTVTTSVYTADRWSMTASGDTASVSKGGAFAIGNNPYPYIAIKPSIHNGNLGIEQRVEDYGSLSNKTVTVSIKLYVDETSTFDVYEGLYDGTPAYTWVNQPKSVTAGSWQTLTWTFVTDAVVTTGANFYYSISIRRTDTGIGRYRMTEAKLEFGKFATPFVADSPADNLAKCQRYYYAMQNTDKHHYVGANASIIHHFFPVTMRVRPTATITGTTGAVINRGDQDWVTFTTATDGDFKIQANAEL